MLLAFAFDDRPIESELLPEWPEWDEWDEPFDDEDEEAGADEAGATDKDFVDP